MKTLMTDKELNQRFPALSLWTINELRRRNEIPYIRLPGIRKYLFDFDKIQDWLEGLENKHE